MSALVPGTLVQIPTPVMTNENGEKLPYWDWTFPRSTAHEAAIRPTLPAGWELYSVLSERAPNAETAAVWARLAGKDFGATREDGRAHAYGVRDINGTPLHIRATVPSRRFGVDSLEQLFPSTHLGEACRWCDANLAKLRTSS